jgi:hypothetical protein
VPSLSDLVAGNVPTGVYHAFDANGKEYTFTAPLGLSDDQIKAEAIKNGLNPSPNMGVVRNVQQTPGITDTVTSNLLNLPSFNGAADLMAAGKTANNYLLRGLGLDGSNASLGDTYTAFAQDQRADEARGNSAHPIAAWSGYLGGIPYALKEIPEGVVNWLGKGDWLARFGKNALVNGVTGAVSGSLSEDPDHMASGAARGAATAIVGAPIINAGIRAVAPAATWAWDRFGPRNFSPNGFMAELGDRLEGIVSPEDMKANYHRLVGGGVQPAPLDVVGPAGQDVIRGIAERPGTNAQPVLEAELNARANAAPQRIATNARAAMSTRAPVVDGMAPSSEPQPMALRQGLGDLRDQQLQDTLGPVRGVPLQLPGDVTDMLEDADMRPVVKGALAFTKDPVERQQITDFAKGLQQGLTGNNLPKLSLGASDALRQSLAKSEGSNTPAITATRQSLTSFLENVPQYRDAMNAYRTQSAVASPQAGGIGDISKVGANKGEAINLGEQLLTGDPERMGLTAASLPELDTPISFGSEGQATVTPRQAAIEGAAKTIQDKATGGGVPSLVKGMATPQQQARNRILLSDKQASNLESGVAAEGERILNAARATPGRYRDSASEDAGDALMHLAGALSHSPVLKARGLVSTFMGRLGISKTLAANVAKGVIDPTLTQKFIDTVAQRGVRRAKALQLMAGIRNLEARGLGIAAGYYGSEARQNLEGNAKPAPIQANSNNGDMYLPQAQEPADQQQSDAAQDDPWQWDGSGQ